MHINPILNTKQEQLFKALVLSFSLKEDSNHNPIYTYKLHTKPKYKTQICTLKRKEKKKRPTPLHIVVENYGI